MRQKSQKPSSDRKKPRIALVLSGGGARGYAHIGIIKALLEAGLEISVIAGCSMGAIVGAHYAAYADIKKLDKDAHHLSKEKPFPIRDIVKRKAGLVSGSHAITILKEILGSVTFDDLKIPLRINAYDLCNNKEIVFSRGPVIDAVRCSMSIPIFFDPIIKDDQIIVDGGIYNNFPFNLLPNDSYDFIIGVNVNQFVQEADPKKLGLFKMVALTQYAITRQILQPQRERFLDMDNTFLIEPNLSMYTAYDFKSYKPILEIGYQTAKAHTAEIQEKIMRTKRRK